MNNFAFVKKPRIATRKNVVSYVRPSAADIFREEIKQRLKSQLVFDP